MTAFATLQDDATPVRIILVGAGEMGGAWLRVVTAASDINLVGVVDLDRDLAQSALADASGELLLAGPEEIAGALAEFVHTLRTGEIPSGKVHSNALSLAALEAWESAKAGLTQRQCVCVICCTTGFDSNDYVRWILRLRGSVTRKDHSQRR